MRAVTGTATANSFNPRPRTRANDEFLRFLAEFGGFNPRPRTRANLIDLL